MINAGLSRREAGRFRAPGSPGASPGRGTGSAPHSLGAKRRGNARLTRRLWRVAVKALDTH